QVARQPSVDSIISERNRYLSADCLNCGRFRRANGLRSPHEGNTADVRDGLNEARIDASASNENKKDPSAHLPKGPLKRRSGRLDAVRTLPGRCPKLGRWDAEAMRSTDMEIARAVGAVAMDLGRGPAG